MDWDLILKLLKALQDHEVDYVLVGAVALAFRGLPRATQDLDLFVNPSEENVARLRDALRTVWDDPEVDQIQPGDLAGEYPVVRYGPPDESFMVDILGRLGEAFRYEDLNWEPVELEGVKARVATPETLFRMKRGTLRLQDKADAASLKARFGLKGEA